MTTPFADKPTLVGDLVTLRPIRADDADTIDRLIREDDDIARLTGSIHHSDEQAMDTPIEDLREIYGAWATADDRLVLAIIDNTTGDLVGEVVLNDWDEGNQSCGYRTLIGRAGRGRGLGTEATRLVVEHGLESMGLHRIALEVDRVLDAAPEELDRHRFGLRAARQQRMDLIAWSTGRLMARMDEAASAANTKVLLHPAKAPVVVRSRNQVAAAVLELDSRLGIERGRDTVMTRRWVEVATDLRDKALDTGADHVDAAKRRGNETFNRARSVTGRLSNGVADRVRLRRDSGKDEPTKEEGEA